MQVITGNGKGLFKKKHGVMFHSDIVDKRHKEHHDRYGHGECKNQDGDVMNKKGRKENEHKDIPGFIHRRKNWLFEKEFILLVKDPNNKKGKFTVFCEEHETVHYLKRRTIAETYLWTPQDFCGGCLMKLKELRGE